MKFYYKYIIVQVFILCILFSLQFYYSSKKADPYFSEQWGLYQKNGIDINVVNMWKVLEESNMKASDEIIVAIIDSGIDYSHEDLQYCAWKNEYEITDGIDNDNNGFIDDIYGWDFCNSTAISTIKGNSADIGVHGTACAGIIAAQHNQVGISGIIDNNNNIKLMSLNVIDDISAQGDIKNVISAIQYADKMEVDVCNLSFSTTKYSSELKEVIEESDMLFVVSAGNHLPFALNIDKNNAYIYPACFDCDNIIVVASIGSNGEISDFSNYGETMVDIATPGENILTTAPDNNYIYLTGTSFAAPFITGVAAILFYEHSNATAVEIKDILLSTASEVNSLTGKVGDNRVLNAYQAVIYNMSVK